jgi:uncharacterized protein (TIGR03435 family)
MRSSLSGRYDFKLTYSYGNAPESPAETAPPIFTAIKEQLGLKLEAVRAPVEAFVIDHVEQPSSN